MGDQIGEIVNGELIYIPIREFLRVRKSNISKINKATDKLYQRLDREPTIEEIVGVKLIERV